MPSVNPESEHRPPPLSGVRVLDLSRILAGPWCTQILGDLGADVVKVERPGGGDDTRSWGPPWLKDQQGQDTTESAYFQCANRNKRSVALDFSKPDDLLTLRALVAQADVLVENFKVGGLAPYGLDAATLRAQHPRLIYCSITGFGQTGPDAGRAGYDFLIQGLGGLMSITGIPEGQPGAGPQKVGVALVDVMTGLYAAIAIQAALIERHRSGLGQTIDTALLDVQVAALANQAASYLSAGVVPGRLGNAHPTIVPYQDFPTADGSLILAVGNDGQFQRLCQELGRPEWASDPRFATNPQRVRHRAELIHLLQHETARRTTAQWVSALESRGVPCGPIHTVEAVFSSPQVQARGLKLELPHASAGVSATVASPLRLSDSPVVAHRAPPVLGQHTQEVLAQWLGVGLNAHGE
jgi:crotonobetainyl-CoA:carnitine CoA-transferase CaiB-like acyl-CoA transferase